MEEGWRDGGGMEGWRRAACEPRQNQRPPCMLESGTKAYGINLIAVALKWGYAYP